MTLIPNVDLDLSAGGMFKNSKPFGATSASVESYWVTFGMTWKFSAASFVEPVVASDEMPMQQQ